MTHAYLSFIYLLDKIQVLLNDMIGTITISNKNGFVLTFFSSLCTALE